MSVILAAATMADSTAIGVVCLVAGAVCSYHRKMLPGAALTIVGILPGGLSIFGFVEAPTGGLK